MSQVAFAETTDSLQPPTREALAQQRYEQLEYLRDLRRVVSENLRPRSALRHPVRSVAAVCVLD